MDGPGSQGVKRARLDHYETPPSQRIPSEPPLHAFANHTLPPPAAYSQQIPPSPYHEPTGDHPRLPDPAQHSYPNASGYSTPIRETRPFQSEASYSRHGSVSAPTRSPDDVQQLAQLRPLNTSSVVEPHPYAQHRHSDSAGPPSMYNGQPNSNSHGLPMPPSSEAPYAPSSQGGLGGYSNSPMHTGPPAYSGGPFSAPSTSPLWQQNRPKKNTRATQACDTCRARKAKCDEGKPMCGFCRENEQMCNYKEVAPAKADRATQQIMTEMHNRATELYQLKAKVDRIESMLERFDKYLSQGLPPLSSRPKVASDGPDVKIRGQTGAENTEKKTLVAAQLAEQDENDGQIADDCDDGQMQGATVAPSSVKNASVSIEHTTAAHRLLRWPSIQALLRHRPVNEDYVMEMEERKGLLRIYGRGQGREFLDGGLLGAGSPASSMRSARSEEHYRTSASASPPQTLWGSGFGPPPPSDPRHPGQPHIGGLNPDGTLKIDYATMKSLLNSYLANIHVMFPFLNRNQLQDLFEKFASRYSPDYNGTTRSPFNPAINSLVIDSYTDTGVSRAKAPKRKHSGGGVAGALADSNFPSPSTSVRTTSNQSFERSITTAIVLLVMALGKICEHTDPLPSPLTDYPPDHVSDPRSFTSAMSSESPPLTSVKQSPTPSQTGMFNSSAPSPMSNSRPSATSRRSSAEATFAHQYGAKNVDKIPGLGYFALATDVLGNQNSGNELAHVQANLLAGLYMGQLACTFESWSWIQNACRACRFLVREPNLDKEPDKARKDLIRFAYWSCLQLESDILAELDLPSSGIDKHETMVAFPQGIVENDGQGAFETNKMMFYYSAQIRLRTILNNIQKDLYPANPKEHPFSFETRDKHENLLVTWRSILPEGMRWRDTDMMSSDINEARMRGKYYGARYIIHRPFLHYALHSQHSASPGNFFYSNAERNRASMGPPLSGSMQSEAAQREILKSAQICVQMAMYSTEAFDGIALKRRLVVTNIFGTAHAQFGNMLVLAATHRSHLGSLVEHSRLIQLLDRTINFLRRLLPISSTLHNDAQILESVLQVVREDNQASSSFSSDRS